MCAITPDQPLNTSLFPAQSDITSEKWAPGASPPVQGQLSLQMPGDFCQYWIIQASLLTDRNHLLRHHLLRFPLKTHTVCLKKGKHETSCIEELRTMEGQLSSREERFCGVTQRHARFPSARQPLIFPPGSCTELAGGWKHDPRLFSSPHRSYILFNVQETTQGRECH